MKKINHFFFIILFVFFLIPLFGLAQTATSTDFQTIIQQLQEQIKTLQTQIVSLQAELASTKEEISSIREEIRLTRILRKGVIGDDVKQLQEFLKQFPDVYPEGLVTGYYGSFTEAAVKRFQENQGIVTEGNPSTTGFGQVGPKTIAKLNEVGVMTFVSSTPSGTTPAVPAEPIGLTGTTTIPAVPAITAQEATTTSTEFLCAKDSAYCATQKECTASGFFWYTLSCHPNPPPLQSCAVSYNYCSSADCSAHGWYWCRNSCYGTADACLGQTYVPPPTSTYTPPPSTTTLTTETTASTTTSTTSSSSDSSSSSSTTVATTTSAGSSFDFSLSNSGNMTVSPGASVSNTVTATLVSGTTQQVSFSIPYELKLSGLFTLTSTSCSPTCSTIVRFNPPSYSSAGSYYTVPVAVTGGGVTKTTSFIFTIGEVSIPQVQGLTATVSGTSVILSWQDVTGAYSLAGSPNNMFGSYNIYRGSSADFIPQLNVNHIAQGSVLSYTNSGLSAGTYYYKIALQDKNGVVGPASQAVSATISGCTGVVSLDKTTYVIGEWYIVTFTGCSDWNLPGTTGTQKYATLIKPDNTKMFVTLYGRGDSNYISSFPTSSGYLPGTYILLVCVLYNSYDDPSCNIGGTWFIASTQFTLTASSTSAVITSQLASILEALTSIVETMKQLLQ